MNAILRLILLCLFAVAVALSPFAQDGSQQKPKQEQPKKDQPKKLRGLGGQLDFGDAEPAKPDKSVNPEASNSPSGTPGNETSELDDQIAKMKAWVAANEILTIWTIDPVTDLRTARERTVVLRNRVNRMRSRLYLPDPKPDGRVTQELAIFQERWGDLVLPIIDGVIPRAALNSERWSGYVMGFSKRYCDAQVVPLLAPPKGMPLGGWPWACLSDSFFHEFAQIEVGVNQALKSKRLEITEPLERTMSAAEKILASLGDDLKDQPNSLLLRQVTWLLHQVNLKGTTLRIRELEYQRQAGSGTAAFRWLLEMSPKIRRPATGSAPKISIAAGTKVRISLAGTSGEASVEESALARLARKLHDIHYRIETLKLSTENSDARNAVETERARTLTAIAQEARLTASE